MALEIIRLNNPFTPREIDAMTSAPHATNPVWMELDQTALAANVALIRRAAGGRKLIASIKGNAYGHGAREIGAMPLILGFIKRFLAYLVLMEALALAVGLTIMPLFRLVLSMDRGVRASAVGNNSVLYTLVFAVAPVLALMFSAMKQKKAAKIAKLPT